MSVDKNLFRTDHREVVAKIENVRKETLPAPAVGDGAEAIDRGRKYEFRCLFAVTNIL